MLYTDSEKKETQKGTKEKVIEMVARRKTFPKCFGNSETVLGEKTDRVVIVSVGQFNFEFTMDICCFTSLCAFQVVMY